MEVGFRHLLSGHYMASPSQAVGCMGTAVADMGTGPDMEIQACTDSGLMVWEASSSIRTEHCGDTRQCRSTKRGRRNICVATNHYQYGAVHQRPLLS